MCISEWEVDVGSQWQNELWEVQSLSNHPTEEGTIRKTQTYQHVLWCCPEGTPEGTTRNPVRLGARGPKFQQTSIENRSKTSISSSSICSVQHFHPISKIQIETCPPFLPQTCHAIMPCPISPHILFGEATSRKTPRVPVQPLVGWNPKSKKEPNLEVNLSVCDDSRGAAHQKWLWAKSPSGSI